MTLPTNNAIAVRFKSSYFIKIILLIDLIHVILYKFMQESERVIYPK